MRQQFQLVYYGHFTWEATEELIPYEREFLYQELKETKHAEHEAVENSRTRK